MSVGFVNEFVFPPDVWAIAGGLGLIFALWSIGRRRAGKPMHPDAAKADGWLAFFSVLVMLVGIARWLATRGAGD